MSDPVELKRVLNDLAEGRINPEQAAALIAGAEQPPAPQPDLESLYEAPPARVLPEADEPDAEVAVESEAPAEPESADPELADEDADEPVQEYWTAPDPETFADEPDGAWAEPEAPENATEIPADEPAATDNEQPDASASGKPGNGDPEVVFSFQIDDVAATAGEVLKDAGDFAKHAWQRIGQFASSVVAPEEHPAPAAATPDQASADEAPRPAGSRGIERLVLRSVGRRVRLVGDPRVATIAVDGPHTLRRQGVTLEVSTEGEIGLNLDAFSVVRPPRRSKTCACSVSDVNSWCV